MWLSEEGYKCFILTFIFLSLFIPQEGSIGHELVIKPVPTDISQAEDGSVHHVIYKRKAHEEHNDQFSDYGTGLTPLAPRAKFTVRGAIKMKFLFPFASKNAAFMEPDRLQKRFRTKRSPQAYYKSSRAIDRTIYPEILVIVDYDGYRLHGGDNVQVKRYFVSFWNGVDLRYRLLKGPKIRISIAGISFDRSVFNKRCRSCRSSLGDQVV